MTPSSSNGLMSPRLDRVKRHDGSESGFNSHGVKAFRDKSITIGGSVLVDHRGPRTGVTKPCHQFFGRRPSPRSKSSCRVAQVVESDASKPDYVMAGIQTLPRKLLRSDGRPVGPAKT
jgi:hypothetical protein